MTIARHQQAARRGNLDIGGITRARIISKHRGGTIKSSAAEIASKAGDARGSISSVLLLHHQRIKRTINDALRSSRSDAAQQKTWRRCGIWRTRK